MSVKLRQRKLPSGRIQLYLVINAEGRRDYEALQLSLSGERHADKEIMRLAEAVRSKREIEVLNEKHGFRDRAKSRTNVFVFADEFIANKIPITQATYTNMLVKLREFHGSDSLIFSQLTQHYCERFRNYMIEKGLHVNTVWAYFQRLRSIFKAAVKAGILNTNPATEVKLSRKDSLPKYLTIEQLRLLNETECQNTVVRDAFFFSVLCGLRYQDIVSLTWDKIVNDGIEISQLKTGESLRIPLSQEALVILERQRFSRYQPKFVKQYKDGTVFKLPRRSTVNKALTRWGARAGISTPITFHVARHSFGTLLLSSDTDLYTASKLMGHRSILTTTIYAKVVDKKKIEAVNRLPQISSPALSTVPRDAPVTGKARP